MSKAATIGLQKARAEVDEVAGSEGARLPAAIDASVDEQPGRISELAHRVTALTRVQKSLLKMVIGMAIGRYGFDPVAARGRSTNEIVSDLRLAGVPLDDDTVLRHLREAVRLLTEEN